MYGIRALRAEYTKSKRTMLNKIPFILSLIVAVCILFISRTSNKDEIVSNSMFYWINISSIIIPLITGILAGIMGEQEQEAGNCQVIKKSSHKGQNFFFKCTYLLGLLTFFILFSMLILCIDIWVVYRPDNFTVFLFVKTALLSIIGSLFLVPFQLWCSFYFNMSASVGFGIFGTIFVAYVSSLPILEEKIWRFIPWTWSMKTTGIYFGSKDLFVQGFHLPLDLVIQVFFFIVLMIGVILWFEKWEGNTKE
ncbi:MAG: lantibiotic immunity ABC transporter MutG family permease subunit [Ruminococcus bicirculans (ex Wegman et al. 2014)]